MDSKSRSEEKYLKISQNEQEKILVGVSFFIKTSGLELYEKGDIPTQVFSCKFLKFLRTPFFIEHDRWLLLPSKKLKNALSSFLESSFSSSKKINNILCIFSFPCIAVHNRKLSKEMCFILSVY